MDTDIELELGPGAGPGEYAVRVIRAPAGGETSAAFRLDVDAILARLAELEATVLASAVSARRIIPNVEKPLHEVGQQLFIALFAGAVNGTYRASLGTAQHQGRPLRVVLRLAAPELAALPWETLFDPDTGFYLCQEMPLLRRIPGANFTPRPLEVDPPLRILGIVAAPYDLPGLDADTEKRHLEKALARPVADGLVELIWAEEPTWDGIQTTLMDGPWHVLHFIGHGDYDTHRQEGRIALETAARRADLVGSSRLVHLLREAEPTPRLVVLNSCASGQAGQEDLFSGTAAAVVRGGISAVAAMQFTISDAAAVAFARGFYNAIAHNRDIDAAAGSGRRSILGLNTLEWVTPVLYVRDGSTRLFTLTGNPTAPIRKARPVARTGVDGKNPLSKRSSRSFPARPTDPFTKILELFHHGEITAIGFTLDGARLATGSTDNAARIWDAATGAQILELPHHGQISAVAFSPDGNQLATGCTDRAARIWDAATGALLLAIPHPEQVSAVAFSPDGTRLATGSRDRSARILDTATGALLLELRHEHRVSTISFSPDGTRLATGGSTDKTARIWDTATGASVMQLTHQSDVLSVSFSRDGNRLASGSMDRTARIWDAVTGDRLLKLGHEHRVSTISFSPDGTRLATGGSTDKAVRIWDTATGALLLEIPHGERVHAVMFSPDGNRLATGGWDNVVRIWYVSS